MKISIITIVFNNKNHIQSCIESVLNQKYDNIEHIIIDGGSTDGTIEKIKPYENRLGYFVSENDSGLYNALNKGIKKSTGDIIGILHSDDLFYNSKAIKKIVKKFYQSKSDLVYADGIYVDRNDIEKVRRVYGSKIYKKWYLYFGWIPLHTTIYVKKEVFEKYGFYDESYAIASDYDISLRWFKERKIKKSYLNKFVVKMRLGGKSTTFKLQKRKSLEDIRIIKNHKLLYHLTLFFKIIRKVRQYVLPKIKNYKIN